jgi:uncharacterized protein (TIGR02594 family)
MNYVITHPEMVANAMDLYGLKELKGENDNPLILKFFDRIGHSWVKSDETAWCSAFINYLAKENGYEMSGKLDARSWLNVGQETNVPNPGDIVIFWRESPQSWKGHVGIFVRDDGNQIYTLGGNQNNSVCIKPYPKSRLLGYRVLNKL